MERWPNFFIVGASKAGTTTLYEYLKKIPGIYMPSAKEPNFFAKDTIPTNHPLSVSCIRTKTEYLNLFKNIKNEKIFGDASNTNLIDPDAAKKIHQVSSSARILISLRDPIEQVYSAYFQLFRNGYVVLPFHDIIIKELENKLDYTDPFQELFRNAMYYENVKRYLEIFGSNKVKIIIFEEFIKNPQETLQEILKFLEINFFIKDFELENYNPYVEFRSELLQKAIKLKPIRIFARRLYFSPVSKILKKEFFVKEQPKPKMDDADRELLKKYYESDVRKLETLLGRKLPWPNFQK